jgi:hypothetical protein
LERRFPHDYPSPRLRGETEVSGLVKLETPPKHTLVIRLDEEGREQWKEMTTKFPIRADGWMDFPIVDSNGNPIDAVRRE